MFIKKITLMYTFWNENLVGVKFLYKALKKTVMNFELQNNLQIFVILTSFVYQLKLQSIIENIKYL